MGLLGAGLVRGTVGLLARRIVVFIREIVVLIRGIVVLVRGIVVQQSPRESPDVLELTDVATWDY